MTDNNDDIFSYSNHGKEEDDSFDLNSFSSNATDKEQSRRKRKTTGKKRIFRIVLSVFLVGVIVVSIAIGAFLLYAFTVVDGNMEGALDNLNLSFTTTIYYQNKQGDWVEYQRLHGEYNRIWVPYDRNLAQAKDETYDGIPESIVNAFVAIEDKRFREHDGVDWKRTAAAFLNMLTGSKSYGGSTITQQLVKNLTQDDQKTVSRKLQEIMRARYIEGHYSKDTIIEAYLNTIYLGHNIYGVGVAANYYFGKNVSELNLAECATIAAITKNPSKFTPNKENEEAKRRRNVILNEMCDQGYITSEECEAAKAQEVNIVASSDAINETQVNNYYVEALISQVTKDLAEKYNYDLSYAASNFYSGGYKIYSTVDPNVQSTVDKVFTNSEAYGIKGKDGSQLQGAMTVMDYSGHVVGLAGGIGEKTVNLGISGFNRATDAIRQPGSTMKPISAYAPAIENDLINYSSIVEDKSEKYGKWTPVNVYKSYKGNMTVEYALEISANTIPVQLVNRLTPQTCYDFLTKKLGVTTLNPVEDVNLSPLGMGGTNGGLTTMQSAAAYAVFGNGGYYYKPSLYYYVKDQQDNVILRNDSKKTVAIGSDTAYIMNKLLQNVIEGSEGTGRVMKNSIPNMKIYGKTGTSNEVIDLWFVGGTPYYVASCWCGYDQQQNVSRSSIAKTMWKEVMTKIHSGLPAKDFAESEYVVSRYYCKTTGLIATDTCPDKAIGWYKRGSIPRVCTDHGGAPLDSPDAAGEEDDKTEDSN